MLEELIRSAIELLSIIGYGALAVLLAILAYILIRVIMRNNNGRD